MHRKPLTYSHSLLIPVTRSCGARCNYCTFKTAAGKLLTFDEIEKMIRQNISTGISEIVVASGQSLETIPEMRTQWTEQGYSSFIHYVGDVCQFVLANNLIPSLDIGPMSYAQLEMVAPYTAAVTLLLENVNSEFAATLQEGKSIDEKIETISDAGSLKIPVTTGLLIGAGESVDDSFATLNTIEELHGKYGHIQSVVFQYVFSDKAVSIPESAYDELQLLIKYSKKIMPDVAVSIPINSPVHWLEGIRVDVDDIGHVYEGTDGLDWQRPFMKLPEIERMIVKNNYFLKPRFPLFENMYKKTWHSENLKSVLNEWIAKKEFISYSLN